MSLIYCPYTDREVPKHQANREHIIPLALGGVDGFEIAVDSKFNFQTWLRPRRGACK